MNPRAPAPGKVSSGIVLALLLQLCQVIIAPAVIILFMKSLEYDAFMLAFQAGLTQWLYLAPALIWCRRTGRTRTAKGLWITGAVIVLLNGTCTGLVYLGSAMSR